jgi:ribosome-binding factor A
MYAIFVLALCLCQSSFIWGFAVQAPSLMGPQLPPQSTSALAGYAAHGRSSPTYGSERSKRQERVGHVVRTELAKILHSGIIRGDADYLEDDLRQRISIISADVSPDLRQARITVSIRNSNDPMSSAAVDKRRAYSWLVENTKPLRHTLAQKMSHMKTCPNLSFAQVDVAAAVDVMYLIEKVASGYKRDTVEEFPEGYEEDLELDEAFFDDDDEDEDDWDDEDDEF